MEARTLRLGDVCPLARLILCLKTARLSHLRRERSVDENVVSTDAFHERGAVLLDHHLVHGQRTRLVRAQHAHARAVLNRREAGHDDAMTVGEASAMVTGELVRDVNKKAGTRRKLKYLTLLHGVTSV